MSRQLSDNPFDILASSLFSDNEEEEPSIEDESNEVDQEDIEQTMSAPPVASFGSLSIRIKQTKENISDDGEEILYPKEDRAKLSSDKLAELFDKATRERHKKYDFINLTLSDEDKLDDTYNLDMLVRRTKNAHVNYDMHNVFKILLLDPSDPDEKTIIGTKDLYTEFSEISVEEVAASNRFYNQWAAEDHFSQNLRLTYAYFQSNVSEELYEKAFETYDEFSSVEKGGPLFFIIMMNLLLSNTEEAAATLQERVKSFKLTNLPGEDISRAVSLLKGAIRRLIHVKRKKSGKDDEWFTEITRQVIKIMQTSSVDEFNNLFAQLEQQRLITQVLHKTGTTKPIVTYDQVFQLAEQKYLTMSELSAWTGVSTRGSESVFNIKSRVTGDNNKKFECFNCGGNHSLQECPQPRNEERITENRKKFLANKRKGNNKKKKKSGKYAGPKPDEHGRRVIDGKLHYYHHNSNRWKLVDRPDDESKAPLANVSTGTGTTAGSTLTATVQPPTSTDVSSTADDLLKFANAKKQFKSTLQGFITQLE